MKKTTMAIVAVIACVLGALLVEVVFAGFCLLLIVRSSVKRSDLIGTYVGGYDCITIFSSDERKKGVYHEGTHSLELRADGTYLYGYDPVEGPEVTTVGKWEFTTEYSRPEVVLNDFMFAPSKTKGRWPWLAEGPGSSYAPVEKIIRGPIWYQVLLILLDAGRIRIVINEDHVYYWLKTRRPDRKSRSAPQGQ